MNSQIASDVSGASAACLASEVLEISRLSQVEAFGRLNGFFLTAFTAYFDALNGWEPTMNEILAELVTKINQIHRELSPGFRKLLDSFDFPFATQNGVLKFGQSLVKDFLEVKELAAKLSEVSRERQQSLASA